MSSNRWNVQSDYNNFDKIIHAQMSKAFERKVKDLIYEYQMKLKEELLKIAVDYSVRISARMDDYTQMQRVQVEVIWPNDETKDSDDEVESPLQEGEER